MGTENLEKLIEIVGGLTHGVFSSSDKGTEAFEAWKASKKELKDLKAALRPFAKFAKMLDARPLKGMDDEFYLIHSGTEHEASLRLSDCRVALKALGED